MLCYTAERLQPPSMQPDRKKETMSEIHVQLSLSLALTLSWFNNIAKKCLNYQYS